MPRFRREAYREILHGPKGIYQAAAIALVTTAAAAAFEFAQPGFPLESKTPPFATTRIGIAL